MTTTLIVVCHPEVSRFLGLRQSIKQGDIQHFLPEPDEVIGQWAPCTP